MNESGSGPGPAEGAIAGVTMVGGLGGGGCHQFHPGEAREGPRGQWWRPQGHAWPCCQVRDSNSNPLKPENSNHGLLNIPSRLSRPTKK